MWQVDWAASLVGGGLGAGIVYWALVSKWPKKSPEKTAEAPAARIPEVGDCFLILDDLWRVRSRDVGSLGVGKGTHCTYTIYMEYVHSTVGVRPNGAKLRSHTPEWLAQWTLVGNMTKDRARVEASLKEIALKHGVSAEEVRIALDSPTGDIDMSNLPSRDKGLPEPPERPRHLKTMTGHEETDRESLPQRFQRRTEEEQREPEKKQRMDGRE